MQDKIIMNDYIENDPLSEENLDKTLEMVNKFRLSFPQKTIWLYTGYKLFTCEYLGKVIYTFNPSYYHPNPLNGKQIKVDDKAYLIKQDRKRVKILENIDIIVDGQYIDSRRDIILLYRGSSNQRVVDAKKH